MFLNKGKEKLHQLLKTFEKIVDNKLKANAYYSRFGISVNRHEAF